jgi:hypothetical protein
MPALWKQIDKTYQNGDLKLKMWEEVAVYVNVLLNKHFVINHGLID